MKKFLCIFAVLLLLSGCSNNLNSVPSLSEIREHGGDWATEMLAGYTADDLERVWGAAPWTLSGFDGYIWRVPADWDEVTVYFEGENREVSYVGYTYAMEAEILSIDQDHVIVMPAEGEWERNSADQIVVNLVNGQENVLEEFTVGDLVLVYHSGMIMETYPAQFEGLCQLVPVERADNWSFRK